MPSSSYKRISKANISHPIVPAVTGTATAVVGNSSSSSIHRITPPSTPPIHTTIERMDVSASVSGGPMDPRHRKQVLTHRTYQSFVQALAAYRRQINAMSAATETFVRSLEEISSTVQSANVNVPGFVNPHLLEQLELLLDSSQMISNTHQIWATSIEKDVEEPLIRSIQAISRSAHEHSERNKAKIQELIVQLNKEEELAYKMKKKKKKHDNIQAIHESLNRRMGMAEEIKRLQAENDHIMDIYTQRHMERSLTVLGKCIPLELETFETLSEGLSKMGMDRGQHSTKASQVQSAPMKTVRFSEKDSVQIISGDKLSEKSDMDETELIQFVQKKLQDL